MPHQHTKSRQPAFPIKMLRNLPTAAAILEAVSDYDLTTLGLSDLVKLKSLMTDRIRENVEASVDVPVEAQKICDRLLADRPIHLPMSSLPASGVRHISVMCPLHLRGSHLGQFGNLAGFLLQNDSLERVSLIFTAEVIPKAWQADTRIQHRTALLEFLRRSVAEFHATGSPTGRLFDKLNVVVAPEIEELAPAIGDVVIRYEGMVPRNQARLCMSSIFAQRPVIATVGSAAVRDVPDVDLLLTPANRALEDNEIHFLRPLQRFPDDPSRLPFTPPPDGRMALLSGYAKNNLARGLMQFGEADWEALGRLFRKSRNIHWHLFGANDPEGVRRSVPPRFLEEFNERMTVDRRIDLADTFRHGFAFLALPGVGGSGTTAKLALRDAVPVLVCRNGLRDISNMFPQPAPHMTFVDLMRILSDWIDQPDARTAYLAAQLDNINQRADVPGKTTEFSQILSQATARFLRRTGDGGSGPSDSEI